jgi:tape measure domain-containing protein
MAETIRELITELGFKIDGMEKAKKYDDTLKHLKESAIHLVEALGLFEIGKKIIESAAGAEQMRVNFEAFTGSAAKANQLMEGIAKYSMATGIGKEALQQSAKQMLAMGIGSDKVMGNLQIIGNLSAGLGKDKIPMLTDALARMNDRGIVNARAFMQLQAAGVPIMDALRKQTGMTTQQLMEMGQKGALKYSDMEKALLSLTTGNGKFANLAMKQATTLNGL